ncbi:DUF924 family protein [Mesorhizobium sp. L-8-3]|uniref:DUF924 family protein n=1 Tax=Mesorhizobium sp. L-8-3 TaxID=2744522 RepID=UPI0019282132|nr:DUF924 family protein [Mesorhizobium sp. L-8-3]BCH27367.1 hypothetical protein MesoLjLb_71520 [Mesorhizobium sp. L-8-3]
MDRVGWVRDVLSFWFAELQPDDWFTRKDATDEAIRQRFLGLWQEMRAAIPAEALLERDAALAATIVLDQFPRNIFRGTADAFATDPLALAVARQALDRGFNRDLPQERRNFLYMPFMHSEALDDQERCVALFGPDHKDVKYAIAHRDIIARFGRFPHRNRALSRASTADEQAFLSGHEGFGQ